MSKTLKIIGIVVLSIVALAVSYTHLDVYKRQTLFDSKLIKDFGEEQLRKSLTNEVFPFFSHYDKLRNYEQITGASVDDGRVGLWHYTFIVDTEGKVLPFQIAIIDTENGPKVLSLLVGQCVKGRHPRIPPCQ